MLKKEDVLNILKRVKYPGFSRDIVSFGIVKDIRIEGGRLSFLLDVPTDKAEVASQIEKGARSALTELPEVQDLDIQARIRAKRVTPFVDRRPIEGVDKVLAVASGKGGVGKSTVAVNLALALDSLGARTGLLDADIYGPSLPIMLGVHERPAIDGDVLIPIDHEGLELMSIGFLLDEDAPVIWRGPLVAQLVKQFLRNVRWGGLDCLVIDLPPGTGDAQLTLVQNVPISGSIIVTTPSDVALIDARRGLRMFRKVDSPVLGIVENMSYFICPHCGKASDIFSRGGGRMVAEELKVPFLGEIPLDPAIRLGGDMGTPIVRENPQGIQAQAFIRIAERVIDALKTAGKA